MFCKIRSSGDETAHLERFQKIENTISENSCPVHTEPKLSVNVTLTLQKQHKIVKRLVLKNIRNTIVIVKSSHLFNVEACYILVNLFLGILCFMFPVSSFLNRPSFKTLTRPSLNEVVFLVAGFLMLAITLMETTLIPQASIAKNDLIVAKIKAQKVVVAQDSLFNVETTQYRP